MEGGVDRISGLPDGILHHILSSLRVGDAIQIASTCKRLNLVWNTLPYLDFGERFFPSLPHEDTDEDGDEDDEAGEVPGEGEVPGDVPGEGEVPGDVPVDVPGEGEVPGDVPREGEVPGDVPGEGEVPGDGEGDVPGEGPGAREVLGEGEVDSRSLMKARYLSEIVRKREMLFSFVERTLARRRMHGLTIQKFHLDLTMLDLELGQHLDRWIYYLVNCNIKELGLQLWGEKWYDLPLISLIAPSLVTLTLRSCMIPCGSITLYSLRKLRLEYVYLEEQTLGEIVRSCTQLEDLYIRYILGLKKKLHVSSSHARLKVLDVCPNKDELFDEVVIEAPYLEKLTYSGGSLLSAINLVSCGSLKYLLLACVKVTKASLFGMIVKLPFLEELMLGSLNLKAIEISSSSLKKLTLSRVFDNFGERGFGDITISIPNLVYFRYRGCISSVFLKSLAVKEVHLSIIEVQKRCKPKLMTFLRIFDYSEVVTLDCSYLEQLIFPMEMRSNILAPLTHVKHLVMQGSLQTSSNDTVSALLESLIWISPNANKFSLKGYYFSSGFPIELFIEVTDFIGGRCDCVTFPRRCWRHRSSLNFKLEGTDDDVCRFVTNYLRHGCCNP